MSRQNQPLQDALALVSQLLMAWIFLPAGIGKLTGFAAY